MKTFIVSVLAFVITIVFIAFIVIGGLYGYANKEATLQLIYSLGIVPPPQLNPQLVGAAIGVVISFLISTTLFGFLFVLLDIRDQLAKQNELMRK